MENIYVNKFGGPNKDVTGFCINLPDEDKAQVQAFRKCHTPYVGGISGSIVERILFLDQIAPDLVTLQSVLVMMAGLNLKGFHSLSETVVGARLALDLLGKMDLANKITVPMGLGG